MSAHNLTQEPVGKTLIRLTIPSFIGIATVILFQVVDAYFVGLLGTDALAAISYTYPVTFFVLNICMGLSIGLTAVVGRSAGKDDRQAVRKLVTHGLMLAFLTTLGCAAFGFVANEWLFRMMNAQTRLLPLIDEYMLIWYTGVPVLSIVMVGNGGLRATGDAASPAIVMMIAGLANVGLDPILIFGFGPIPAMGMRGAAIATVASFCFAAVMWGWLAIYKQNLLTRQCFSSREILASWKSIMRVGAPSVATNVLVPTANAILTRIIAQYGVVAVAAFGIGQRVESLAMVGFYALSTGLVPFTAQNYGAEKPDRLLIAFRYAISWAFLYGALIAAFLWVISGPIVGLFSEDPAVHELGEFFLTYIPWTYGLFGSSLLIGSIFNGLNRPFYSALLMIFRLCVLLVPLGWYGASVGQTPGVFAGLASAYFLGGVVSLVGLQMFLKRGSPFARAS